MGFNALMADNAWSNLASTTCDGEAVRTPRYLNSLHSLTLSPHGKVVGPGGSLSPMWITSVFGLLISRPTRLALDTNRWRVRSALSGVSEMMAMSSA
ncbi:hypothetical protein ACOMHN_031256 [Nucella lapillus]